MNTRPEPPRNASLKANQRGVVLFIALIVMVAMSLAAIALMRSVDTTSTVIGNLAFRQASILPANFAIEDAAAGLFSDANFFLPPRIADVRSDAPDQNYYACAGSVACGPAASWDDAHGVPQPLQTKAAAAALQHKLPPDGTNNTITYVVERMCNPNATTIPADHSAAASWCDMMPPKQSPGATINDPAAAVLTAQPFYRVTVRVDGAQGTNTVSFAQAMLR